MISSSNDWVRNKEKVVSCSKCNFTNLRRLLNEIRVEMKGRMKGTSLVKDQIEIY